MKDLEDRVFLFQNPSHFMRALKKKNYEMTQLIEQTPSSLFHMDSLAFNRNVRDVITQSFAKFLFKPKTVVTANPAHGLV